jgi:hypothetical protein
MPSANSKRGTKSGVLPKLKKSISSFTKGERGQISKQNMLTVGTIVGGAAIGAAISLKAVKWRPYALKLSSPIGQETQDTTSPQFNTTEIVNENVTVSFSKSGGITVNHSSY